MKIILTMILLALLVTCADARMPQVGEKVSIKTVNTDIDGVVTEIADTMISVEGYMGSNKIDVCIGLGSITTLTWVT
ncbi:hypothetical protein M0R72_06820 [Candidatus Pacearchaeota archaeon]|jgi:hypothetical protein|nr:hypothetical protein [Candidatus Pacearchaeota archaeon]